MTKSIVWLRQDLRTFDHPALQSALESSEKVLALYIDDTSDPWMPASASKWWLHHALKDLKEKLKNKNIPLVFMKGDPLDSLKAVMSHTKATHLFYAQRVEPYARKIEQKIETELSKEIILQKTSFDLLHDPQAIYPASSRFYQVFTPFWKRLLTTTLARPLGEIPKAQHLWNINFGLLLEDLDLLPKIKWDSGFYKEWDPSEEGGWNRAKFFINEKAEAYETARDRPDLDGVSKLAPYLHFGQLSARQIVFAMQKKFKLNHPLEHPVTRQIAWREFAHHLLWHCPHTPLEPLKTSFESFRWQESSLHLNAWKKGLTGYPIVDAAMRQLWQTGWMHNRLRMVVGSFLVKDLLINWTQGAKWFWDTLLDADLANNTLGWQWIAGCGADAAPFFRIFNPVTQSEKFDPEGLFIRHFIPELSQAETKWLHAPWKFSKELEYRGIKLGQDYPLPIVEHVQAREKALEAYQRIKSV